ncbi:ABC transporter substrate-binding protein [uncultured Roseobacter sp.]|uniref:substrate-binding periplasmic protein n=1 Tax=uncultured Roseobacter sp. TaxID=114847 RepID=UPI00262A0A2A|nr:transporter substrate-binding domain-containing protein [uncultured Roseobacter sp.]
MKFVLLVLAALAVLLTDSRPGQAETLRIATGEYAPYTDSSAPGGGAVNSTVQAIAEAAGFEAEFDYMPWMRALEMTRMGRFHASSYWGYQAAREEDFWHVGPVMQDPILLFHRADAPLPDWERLPDLQGVTIGAVTGYTYSDDFWELADSGQITVETAQSDEANMRKLLAGRIDAFPMTSQSGQALLATLFSEAERQQIRTHPQPLMVSTGYLLVSRNADGAEAIAEALQNALDSTELARR